MVCATRWTSEHDRHRVPPDSLARPARPVPRAARRGVPWTADTVYLNNANIRPIPERTRRALDEFTAKRTAPHLLPDRQLQAGPPAAPLPRAPAPQSPP